MKMGISIQPHSRCLNINTGHLDFLQKSGGRGEKTERERETLRFSRYMWYYIHKSFLIAPDQIVTLNIKRESSI